MSLSRARDDDNRPWQTRLKASEGTDQRGSRGAEQGRNQAESKVETNQAADQGQMPGRFRPIEMFNGLGKVPVGPGPEVKKDERHDQGNGHHGMYMPSGQTRHQHQENPKPTQPDKGDSYPDQAKKPIKDRQHQWLAIKANQAVVGCRPQNKMGKNHAANPDQGTQLMQGEGKRPLKGCGH